MLDTVLGIKLDTVQRFTQDGRRIPVTRIKTGSCYVVQIKRKEKDGYNALQLGWGGRKRIFRVNKPLKGHLRGARLKKAPLYLTEVKVDEVSSFKVGEEIDLVGILKPGDKVKVTGWSKGKGFTGVVKRWGFAGGPRTHGQSDRERAPGSIGQTTTPGRVFKGKKMAGRAGGARTTISGLMVVGVDLTNDLLLIKGLVPGPKGGKLIIVRVGREEGFVPLLEVGEREIKKIGERKATLSNKEVKKRSEEVGGLAGEEKK